MCGIVGIINHKRNGISATDRNIFKRLLFLDVERGPDSTGMFVIQNTGQATLLKKAVPSFDFMKDKEVDDLLNKAYGNGTFVVGHNRKATQGSIKDENAHPFAEGRIVLVHNGSLWNHRTVADVDVDSKAIAMELNKKNNNVTEVFNHLKGAYACVWYNDEDSTLNFFRNKERPLYFYKDINTTFFASESLMLYYALVREGIKWETDKCVPLEVHKHVSFAMEKHGGSKSPKQVDVDITEGFTQAPTTTGGQTQTGGTGKEQASAKGDHISLSQRKRMRNQFQAFLSKHKIGSEVSFIPEDVLPSKGGWLIVGRVEGAPDYVIAMAHVSDMKEDQVMEMCVTPDDMPLSAVTTSYTLNHKQMEFQLDVKINAQILSAFRAVQSGKTH